MAQLEPCPQCRRHVRTSETVCPFCAADIAAAMQGAPARAMPTGRLGRAALFAFGLSVATTSALEGCSDDGDDNSDNDGSSKAGDGGNASDAAHGDAGSEDAGAHDASTGIDSGASTQHDAGPADSGHGDAGNPDASKSDASASDAGASDAGASDAGRVRDSGGVIALYGLPAPLYGAPTQGESS